MDQKLRILHLEDTLTDAELVDRELKRANINFEKQLVDTEPEFTAALKHFKPHIVLSDHSLPSFNSVEALQLVKASELDIPFILLTATVSEEFAVNVMKEGATDYILKDRLQRLPNAIINAIEKNRIKAEHKTASDELSLLYNTIDEVFFSRDIVNHITTQISPACKAVFGYDVQQFLDDANLWQKILHPDDFGVLEIYDKPYTQGDIDLLEFRINHKDGSERWIESKVIPSFSATGELLRLYGVARDITLRKNAEIERQKSNDLLSNAMEIQASLLNAIPASIALLNESGKIMAVNQAWKERANEVNLGMPNFAVGFRYFPIGERMNVSDEQVTGDVNKGIKEVILGQKPELCIEYSYIDKNEKKWSQILAAPLAHGSPKGAVVINSDITNRKLAEESLHQSEINLRSVFENTDLCILMFDSEMNVVSFNSHAQNLAQGYLKKKLKAGKPGMYYFPKHRRAGVKQIIENVRHQPEAIVYETTFEIQKGVVRWFEVTWKSVPDKKGNNSGIILTIKNITDKKNAEFERSKITADLIQRNKDLEQFTYIVSHNLRAPLANIVGLSGLLADWEHSSEENDVLETLSVSVNKLDDIINDLNQILETNTSFKDRLDHINLFALMRELQSSLHQLVTQSNTSITCNFKEVEELISSKSYLYSIFQNLIVNSIKYKHPDRSPVIDITSSVVNNRAVISFKDNGKGIDLVAHGAQIFGLYKRFDNSSNGKGMGLFMVKMQVESLGGAINVQSEPRSGTEFTIDLPLVFNN